ncbi:MAG: hypothetical protein ABMB14_04780 [Myxococcota bacterium]
MDTILWIGLTGCAGHEPLKVGGLEPLEDNTAAFPGDDDPEGISIVSGGNSDLWWAHGRGYVDAPFDAVWAAARDPEVGVDRREVDEWVVSDVPSPTLDASYQVHCLVNDVITVEYDLWWRHDLSSPDDTSGLALDDEATADRLVALWDKTEGTVFIDLLAGSLVLYPTEDGRTAVELIEHLKAPLRDDLTLVAYLEDFHATLVAASHGEALPVW